jgi:DNA-binding beta-propeller fold protein YncE
MGKGLVLVFIFGIAKAFAMARDPGGIAIIDGPDGLMAIVCDKNTESSATVFEYKNNQWIVVDLPTKTHIKDQIQLGYCASYSLAALRANGWGAEKISANIGRIPRPTAIAITPTGELTALVANENQNCVSAFTFNGEVWSSNGPPITENIGKNPQSVVIAKTPDGKMSAIVSNMGSNDISILTYDQGVWRALNRPVCQYLLTLPMGVAISPDQTTAYITNYGADTISVFVYKKGVWVPDQLIADVGGRNPSDIAVSPDGNTLFVTNCGTSNVAVMQKIGGVWDGPTAIKKNIGVVPSGVAVTPDGKMALILNSGSSDISVLVYNSDEGTWSAPSPPIPFNDVESKMKKRLKELQ